MFDNDDGDNNDDTSWPLRTKNTHVSHDMPVHDHRCHAEKQHGGSVVPATGIIGYGARQQIVIAVVVEVSATAHGISEISRGLITINVLNYW